MLATGGMHTLVSVCCPERIWVSILMRFRNYLQLVKARLSLMVLMSGLVGYWLASIDVVLSHLLLFALGTFFVVAGANAFNQIIERDSDARMLRTKKRPLPAGRLSVYEATIVAILLSGAGISVLFVTSGNLCGLLSVVALLTYVLIYTPLKSVSPWSTVPGAISGAIPPLMGWAAVHNELGILAWCLFGTLFFWQFPHTWAIASAYREDYMQAGSQLFPVDGMRRRTVVLTLLLVGVSLLPTVFGFTGSIYLVGASILGVFVIVAAVRFGNGTIKRTAIQLLITSLFYLPLVLMLLALDSKVI